MLLIANVNRRVDRLGRLKVDHPCGIAFTAEQGAVDIVRSP